MRPIHTYVGGPALRTELLYTGVFIPATTVPLVYYLWTQDKKLGHGC